MLAETAEEVWKKLDDLKPHLRQRELDLLLTYRDRAEKDKQDLKQRNAELNAVRQFIKPVSFDFYFNFSDIPPSYLMDLLSLRLVGAVGAQNDARSLHPQ